MNDNQVEDEIQAKVLTAPRITMDDIDDNIVSVVYFTAMDGVRGEAMANCGPSTRVGDVVYSDGRYHERSLELLTFCVLTLRNGFTVTGESACASPENFDHVIGRRLARANAFSKVWPLMGYELRSKLAVIENLKAGN